MSDVVLTIGLCAYGEAANLRVLLPKVKEAASTLGVTHEVVVVEAQKPVDETAAVCEAMNIRCVRRRGGGSYGDALRTLLVEARGEFLLNMDADGSHSPDDIRRLWDNREGCGVVIGSRYVDGASSSNPLYLRVMSWCLNWAFRVVTGLAVNDFSNSFRLYRREFVVDLELQANDFNVLQEILLRAARAHPNMKTVEVAVGFSTRHHGVSKRKTIHFLRSYAKTLWAFRR